MNTIRTTIGGKTVTGTIGASAVRYISNADLQQAVDAYLAANPPTGEVDADSLQAAVNTALTRAKETGEFDGYTPERGTDYWTDTDKTEIVNAVLANFTDVSGVGM